MSEKIFSQLPEILLDSYVVVRPAIISNKVKIIQAIDDPVNKKVKAQVILNLQPTEVIWLDIWSGNEYIEIGNWTDSQLTEKVKSVVLQNYQIHNI